MKSNENIIKYLNDNYSTYEILDLLKKNSLYYKLADEFVALKSEDKEKNLTMNRLFNSLNMIVAYDIFSGIKKMNIEYISFKGFVLSQLLYDSPNERAWGDVDFYISPQYFDKVYAYLTKNGFRLFDENELSNQHHVALIKGKIILELHRSFFHPMLGINEKFLSENLKLYTIKDRNIITFNETATILHLIYHLYMDTYFAINNLYSAITNKEIPKATRFLYRAYEIALFSEKYYNKINWKDIESDVKCQKLGIIFKYMILDIVEIFPNAFPKSFIETIFQLECINNEKEKLYKQLKEALSQNSKKDTDDVLRIFIEENWNKNKKKNISIKLGENILLIKKTADIKPQQDLYCDINTERINEGIKIDFKVSNDDLCITGNENFDTHASDGVHLLLCGTERYSYNSIFFFPKDVNGVMKVMAYDVLNNKNKVLDDKMITAQFFNTDRDYTITVVLSNKFIEKNCFGSHFYMGLVISDCSDNIQGRRNQLILTEDDSQWNNPTYFAKINME